MTTSTRTLELTEELVKEITVGIDRTFMSLFGVQPVLGQFTIENRCQVDGDVAGLMVMKQEKVEGALIISFPQNTIFQILSLLYRRPFTTIDPSVKSGVGEITNSVYGVMKTEVNKRGYHFKMDVPNVIVGSGRPAATLESGQTVVIPYTTAQGNFTVRLIVFPQAQVKAA